MTIQEKLELSKSLQIENMTTQQIVNYLFEKHNIQKIVNLVDKWGYTLSPNESVYAQDLETPTIYLGKGGYELRFEKSGEPSCQCGNCEECCGMSENECAN